MVVHVHTQAANLHPVCETFSEGSRTCTADRCGWKNKSSFVAKTKSDGGFQQTNVVATQEWSQWTWHECAERCALTTGCARWSLSVGKSKDGPCRLYTRVPGQNITHEVVSAKYDTYEGVGDLQCARTCTAGTFMETLPNGSRSPRCSTCAPGYFADEPQHIRPNCTAQITCSAGERIVNLAPTLRAACEDCEAGKFQAAAAQHRVASCLIHRRCRAGHFHTTGPNNKTHGGDCRVCPTGTYQDHPLHQFETCVPQPSCTSVSTAGQHQSAYLARANATTKGVCELKNRTTTTKSAVIEIGLGAAPARCGKGERRSGTTCSGCSAGQYQDSPAHTETACKTSNAVECGPGTRVSNSTTDVPSCVPCPDSTYQPATAHQSYACLSQPTCTTVLTTAGMAASRSKMQKVPCGSSNLQGQETTSPQSSSVGGTTIALAIAVPLVLIAAIAILVALKRKDKRAQLAKGNAASNEESQASAASTANNPGNLEGANNPIGISLRTASAHRQITVIMATIHACESNTCTMCTRICMCYRSRAAHDNALLSHISLCYSNDALLSEANTHMDVHTCTAVEVCGRAFICTGPLHRRSQLTFTSN